MEYRKLGRFHIENTLARGGMGEIVRSVDDSGRPIALKTILDTYREDERFQELFIREAEITFQLKHPNIVRAYRFDKVGNRLVLALEYLDGVNLKDVLRKIYDKSLQMPLMIALGVAERVMEGLHYAHNKKDEFGRPLGIIHRDMNPSNIFVTFSGEVKILDFGISKATQLEVHNLTPKNEIRGKVCYLAPEQIRSKAFDHRADVFSLGIVLWECLAGRPLFVRSTDSEVMESIVDGEYKSIRKFRPDVPEEVDQVLRKALAVNPQDRFKDCLEFKAALRAAGKKQTMPGVGEFEISVFVRSLLGKNANKDDPQFMSGFAFLMTQSHGNEKRGLEISETLARRYPTRPDIQLNHARALLLKGDRVEGLRLMRRLARVDSLEGQVQQILEWVGVRRPPVIPNLSRSNPLNFALGVIRHKILGPTPYQQQFLAAQ